MQTKEVKIAGFQSENIKLTLTYQVTRDWSRYIIRKNRKIVKRYAPIEPWTNKMITDFCGEICRELLQKQLSI